MQQCQVRRGSFHSDGRGCGRWQKCKYHTKSSSEQSSESTDLCTDAVQETLSADVEIQIKTGNKCASEFTSASSGKP